MERGPVLLATFLLLLVRGPAPVLGQTEEQYEASRNAVYLELGGQGGLYSINYEYRFLKSFSARAGFSIWSFPFFVADVDFLGVPLMVNALIGGRFANLEIGVGVIAVSASSTDFFFGKTSSTGPIAVATGTVGYRHQSVDGGFVFRIGFTPVYYDGYVVPSFALSFGHAF
jgi:hypothetical protein